MQAAEIATGTEAKGPLCWICHQALKCRQLPSNGTGLCQRCYSREYQRAVRTGETMIRFPDDARAAIAKGGRPDMIRILDNLPPPPPPPPPKPVPLEGDAAEIDRLRRRLGKAAEVIEAARAWYRNPFIAPTVKRLKAAVESLNRTDGVVATRDLD